ncbi:MAG: peptidase T [Clostridia bacterium]|nr:peptidase T [Clostridia bacterium]
MENVEDRFLRYANILTASDEDSGKTNPSTDCQFDLARLLEKEMKELGLEDVRLSDRCYVYGILPATAGMENKKCLGLIAHMDTVNCVPAAPLKARKLLYEGGDIILNAEKGIVMREEDFDSLKKVRGHHLIVTDGTTCLGADDKAGVAEIMALMEYYREHPGEKHSRIAVGFTCDEEIGCGADFFDVGAFGASYAYTVDGGEANEIEVETFNAASLSVRVKGLSIHPGSAKDKMVNAARVAMEYDSLLPEAETPEHTEGREGFYHLCDMTGSVDHAVLRYIIRDHDREKFEKRKAFARRAAEYLNGKYPAGTVEIEIRDSYFNMAEILKDMPEVSERACRAIRRAGMEPVSHPVRGGTDGSRLTFMGLPCPNLGTGGRNCHGVYEYASVEEMRAVVEVLKALTGPQDGE